MFFKTLGDLRNTVLSRMCELKAYQVSYFTDRNIRALKALKGCLNLSQNIVDEFYSTILCLEETNLSIIKPSNLMCKFWE